MTKRIVKNVISGMKAVKMIEKIEATRTEVITSEDPWWGTRKTTYTYVTIEGIEYKKVTDRDGWPELLEIEEKEI